MDEATERIINSWKSQSDIRLVKLILESKGTITVKDFPANDEADRRRLDGLKAAVKREVEKKWREVRDSNSIAEYRNYLNAYGHTEAHVEEARDFLTNKDKEQWEKVKATLEGENLSNEKIVAAIEEYKQLFPEGIYYNQCKDCIDDIPWFQTKAKKNRKAYELYKEQYPGKHEDEIRELIERIDDDNDWKTAEKNGSVKAYEAYCKKHPKGAHVEDASERIENRSAKDILLEELEIDPNKYSVEELKNKIANAADFDYKDLINPKVFNKEQVDAIEHYVAPEQLPTCNPPKELPRGYTEVYFWGLRGTGKTCAIGATIGYLSNIRRSLKPNKDNLPAVNNYIRQLQQLFSMGGRICMLPPRTVTGNLPAMSFSFNEKKEEDNYINLFFGMDGEFLKKEIVKIDKDPNGIKVPDEVIVTFKNKFTHVDHPSWEEDENKNFAAHFTGDKGKEICIFTPDGIMKEELYVLDPANMSSEIKNYLKSNYEKFEPTEYLSSNSYYKVTMSPKKDNKNKNKIPKEHRVTLVDVAGEVFAGIFKQSQGIEISSEEAMAINDLKKCLTDTYNNKIHFFIVEYGDDSLLEIPGCGRATKSQVMLSLAGFFEQQNLFNDSAVSLNLMVTKCDKIREGDRMTKVQKYVEESGWGVAANGINDISIHARTGCMYGMGFSIGEVFAQDLCIFCPDDAEAIVTEIEERTPAYSNTTLGRLTDWFRH